MLSWHLQVSVTSFLVQRQDYMLFELLKNAMRAVVEAHRHGRSLPPVHVHICKAPSAVTLRISDQVRAPDQVFACCIRALTAYDYGHLWSDADCCSPTVVEHL